MSNRDFANFQEIPNIGPAMEKDFQILGLKKPQDLIGQDPYELYTTLCLKTGSWHDLCVIDVFISAVRYMEGAPQRKWWYYTGERKKRLARIGRIEEA